MFGCTLEHFLDFAGDSCGHSSPEIRKRSWAIKRCKHPSRDCDLPFRPRFWPVVGPTRVVSTERALPSRDQIGRSSHGGVCEHVVHRDHCSMLPSVSLSPQIWNFLALRGLDLHNDLLYILPLARNEASADWGDTLLVPKSLVLEEILRRGELHGQEGNEGHEIVRMCSLNIFLYQERKWSDDESICVYGCIFYFNTRI